MFILSTSVRGLVIMNTYKHTLSAPSLPSQEFCNSHYNLYYLSMFIALCLFVLNTNIAFAQGYAMGGYAGGMAGVGGGMGGRSSAGSSYYGAAQAKVDHSVFSGNHEMLRNDMDYEDYLLQKRNAFAQQMQQNESSDDKLRGYAETRLKALSSKGTKLSAAEQGESHDLMDWLKKDAEQRANNIAWLKRQNTEIAMVEQDQDISFKNQRNSLHNMFEDSLNIESQWKWNQQMQLANLHQLQANNGAIYGSHQPFANAGLNGNAVNGFGGGVGGRWGW